MLKLIKKGDKYWLFEDSEIGEFSPSKFTINILNNIITIVYENGLKSKKYNVIDCEIYDLGELTPFTTSSGDLFMQKLEELNCPCFQKNENIYNIYGVGDLQQTTDLGNTTTNPIETGNITVTENQGGDPPIKIIQDITDTDTFVAVEESSSSFNYTFKIKPLTASRVIYVEDESGSIATREWVSANAGGSNVITEINTTGTASSGTTETITYAELIPANTLEVGVYDAVARVNKSNVNGGVILNLYVNTVNNLTGSPILIGRSISTSTARYMPIQKFIDVKVLNGTGLGTEVANVANNAQFSNDYIQHGNTGGMTNVAIDWTVNQYLILTVTNGSASDSSTGTFLILKK